MLATPAFTDVAHRERRFPNQERPTDIAIVDIELGETTLIPDSDPEGTYGRIAWSEDGQRLYFATSSRGCAAPHGRFSAYDLRTEKTDLVPFDLKDTIFQLAAF